MCTRHDVPYNKISYKESTSRSRVFRFSGLDCACSLNCAWGKSHLMKCSGFSPTRRFVLVSHFPGIICLLLPTKSVTLRELPVEGESMAFERDGRLAAQP